MAKGDGPSESVMFVSEEVAALRADLKIMKREKVATQAELARVQLENRKHGMRLRRERSWGTSFDRQGGDQLIDEELLFRLWAPCGHVG